MPALQLSKLFPFIETFGEYKKEYVRKDIIAALTVTVVGLPQYMAYALIAGVDPVYGLYTGIIACIIGSAFGSSHHLMTGPTNAICLLTASAMIRYMDLPNAHLLLFLMTFMVGALQMLYGVLRLGKVIDFVSHSVLVGFTAGAGILIALGQLNTLLGISIKDSAAMSTVQKMYYLVLHIGETNKYALGLGILTMAIIIVCKKVSKNLPGALIGIVAPIFFIVAFSLEQKGVKLTGDMPSSLPPFQMVHFSIEGISAMMSGAIAISIIGLVEAISISKSLATNSHQKIDSNREFMGQGLSNVIGSFFQCLPASGSFSRSAINYTNGGVTRFTGILSGVFVAVILLFFAPYAKYIPNPCLAGVLIITGYNLVDKKEIKKISQAGLLSSDFLAMLVTLTLVIVLPSLDHAIYAGIALSIALYLKDTNKAPIKLLVPTDGQGSQVILEEVKTVKSTVNILIIQLEGSLYFGGSTDLGEKLNGLVGKSKVFILRMNFVTSIDLTALNALKVFTRNVKEAGGILIISGVNSRIRPMLEKTNAISDIEADSIFMTEDEVFASSTNALERAKNVLNCESKPSKSGPCTIIDSITPN